MSTSSLPRPAIIVFDMDGTLVDISQSYRAGLPVAAECYLRLLGIRPPALTADAYDQFKLIGGFNDDWDLTAAYLELLVGGLPAARPLGSGPWSRQDDLLAALRRAATPLAGLTAPLPDLARLIEPARRAGGGPAGLRRVSGGCNAHLVCHRGSAATTDLVQRVFEEIYLGSELFATAYGMPARFYEGPGLIEREPLLISHRVLQGLSRFARLGIATGRARFELQPTLIRLGLTGYFSALATMTDAIEAQAPGGESLLKPDPYLLQLAANSLDPDGQSLAAYVGDTRDDILAAQRARAGRPWQAVALTTAQDKLSLRAQFETLGADAVLEHPDELLGLWA
jgi:HAD superfamily hydrolase (TIGR01548 family)